MDMNEKWQRCMGFHGHACKGLLSGFMAALYASRLLGLGFSEDEEVVCIPSIGGTLANRSASS